MSSETKDGTFKVKTLNLFTEELVGLFKSRGLTIIQCSEHIDKLQSTIATQSTRIAELERELSDANNEAASLGQLNGELKAEVERLQSQSPLPEGAVKDGTVFQAGEWYEPTGKRDYPKKGEPFLSCATGRIYVADDDWEPNDVDDKRAIYRQLTPEETSRLSPERQSGEEYSEPIGDREGTYWHHDNRIEWRSGKGTEADCERIQVATFVNYQRAGEFWHKWNEHKHKAEYMAEAIRERDKFKAEAERQSGSDDYAHLSRHCKRLAEHCKVPKRATENPFEQLGDVEHAVNQLRADLAEAKAQLSTAVQVKEGDEPEELFAIKRQRNGVVYAVQHRQGLINLNDGWKSEVAEAAIALLKTIKKTVPSAPTGAGESDDKMAEHGYAFDKPWCLLAQPCKKCGEIPPKCWCNARVEFPAEPSPAGTEGAETPRAVGLKEMTLTQQAIESIDELLKHPGPTFVIQDPICDAAVSRLKAENETLKGLLRECKLPIELFRNHGQWSVPFRENLDQLLDAIDSALAPTAEAKNV